MKPRKFLALETFESEGRFCKEGEVYTAVSIGNGYKLIFENGDMNFVTELFERTVESWKESFLELPQYEVIKDLTGLIDFTGKPELITEGTLWFKVEPDHIPNKIKNIQDVMDRRERFAIINDSEQSTYWLDLSPQFISEFMKKVVI